MEPPSRCDDVAVRRHGRRCCRGELANRRRYDLIKDFAARAFALDHLDGRAYFDRTVISSIAITATAAILLLVAIVALTTRRLRAHDRFELGSVSQQWLLGHKGDER
jgi:hypothetical protein